MTQFTNHRESSLHWNQATTVEPGLVFLEHPESSSLPDQTY